MSRVARTVSALLFSLAVCLPAALAQQAQDPQDPNALPAPKKLDKDAKRKMKRTLKELDSAYKQWLNEDVVYIITPVVLFLEIVVWQVRIAAAAQPELLDELLSFLAGL